MLKFERPRRDVARRTARRVPVRVCVRARKDDRRTEVAEHVRADVVERERRASRGALPRRGARARAAEVEHKARDEHAVDADAGVSGVAWVARKGGLHVVEEVGGVEVLGPGSGVE